MKITSLTLENFRHLTNQTIEIGSIMTAIAGQNGTGKSSLLGWIAQAANFSGTEKTLSNSFFKSKYSEIFRFCPIKDYKNQYNVTLNFEENNIADFKKLSTRYIKNDNRYRVDFDGRGTALNFPVVFLGLKRLIPLASENDIEIQSTVLGSADVTHFSKLSREILFLTREKIESEFVKSTNKQMLAMKTAKYGHLGNSAGQDSLGQIIASILSFRKLKEEIGENYKGGILLIDEIDATLYAGSQLMLIDKLFNLARRFEVQVIFTTHSLEILEKLSEKTGDETKINFLTCFDDTVVNEVNPDIEWLKHVIREQTGNSVKPAKIHFICEDEVAEAWGRNLLNGSLLKKEIEISRGSFPDGTIIEMAKSKHPIFKSANFVLDGDAIKNHAQKKLRKIVFLPGSDKPEKVFFDFFYQLKDGDEFWDKRNNFTHRTCFNKFIDSKNHKAWFNDPSNQRFFGKGNARLFNRWKKGNLDATKKFIDAMHEIIKSDKL